MPRSGQWEFSPGFQPRETLPSVFCPERAWGIEPVVYASTNQLGSFLPSSSNWCGIDDLNGRPFRANRWLELTCKSYALSGRRVRGGFPGLKPLNLGARFWFIVNARSSRLAREAPWTLGTGWKPMLH